VTEADELVVVRCQLGERAAFETLVRRWHHDLCRYLRHLSGADPEDLAQDVWLKVLRGLPRLRDPERFPTWLFTTARRQVIDTRRRHVPVPATGMDDEAGPDATPGVLDRLAIEGALDTLPAAEREAVVLYHLADLAVADVAAVQGVAVGTVKSRLHRARRLLADRLDDRSSS
jgi:RNA polymerase sigma factor (sigma-70 family)